jgi:hypothetical protein
MSNVVNISETAFQQREQLRKSRVSDLTHYRGYTAFFRLNPARFIDIEPAYVHSLKFNQDAATVTVGFDLRALFGGRR